MSNSFYSELLLHVHFIYMHGQYMDSFLLHKKTL